MTEVEGRLRELAPQVLGAVARRYGSFDDAEDAGRTTSLAERDYPTARAARLSAWSWRGR